ncbi:hypothetical protein [uncultured Nocardioides sp.]|mgnify:FL=1|uniref:hypothetical protein n=1 Tax=uncultured Nocardioides sp. TaxID=198441 RepID=UPI002637D0B0|nr:hypothetical protein [uncultured Nocardioides sp.]
MTDEHPSGTTPRSRPGGVLVLLLLVLALAAALLWARPWRPTVEAVTTGEVSCGWDEGAAVVRVPVRVEGRGDVPVVVRAFVHRVRDPRTQPYVSTVDTEVAAGSRRVVELSIAMTRREWREGRAACSVAVAVGEDPPPLP